MEIVRESSRRQKEGFDPDDPEILKLSEELDDMLTLKIPPGC